MIFRDGADRVNQVLPFSAFDSSDPAELWKYMDVYAKKTGGQVLTIPHNGNLSNGQMCSAETFGGKPGNRAFAEARASHEPLFEATQIKGDSETHPCLSSNDEFASFEGWDINSGTMETAQNSVLQGNYVRSALRRGLELDARLGAYPFKSGLIGGNDAHVSVVTTREDNFFGEFANGLPSPDRWKTPLAMTNNDPKKGPLLSVWNESASGLGGVWARENTREEIWDALKRKEVYATTGDRPTPCACWRAGTSCRRISIVLNSPKTATPTACRGVVTSSRHPTAGHRPSWFTQCEIRTVTTLTASRSSRAGLVKTAIRRSVFSTWRSLADARSDLMAAA